MTEVNNALDQLVAAMKETKEYEAYHQAKENVKNHPGLKEQIDEFRIRNFELQNMAHAHSSELLFEIDELEREYESFRENPVVDEFLKAELGFCRMVQNVTAYLAAELDFE